MRLYQKLCLQFFFFSLEQKINPPSWCVLGKWSRQETGGPLKLQRKALVLDTVQVQTQDKSHPQSSTAQKDQHFTAQHESQTDISKSHPRILK